MTFSDFGSCSTFYTTSSSLLTYYCTPLLAALNLYVIFPVKGIQNTVARLLQFTGFLSLCCRHQCPLHRVIYAPRFKTPHLHANSGLQPQGVWCILLCKLSLLQDPASLVVGMSFHPHSSMPLLLSLKTSFFR